MLGSILPRRAFLRNVGASAALSYLPASAAPLPTNASDSTLDQFIARYLAAMNAPGLTLGMATKEGTKRTAGFGYSDLEAKIPVTADLMFEIGSITKSFVALTLLQLRDEDKLDLHRPILEYLPWLPIEANYGVITVHHLLTHSSGLPDALGLFLSDPQARHVQGFKPGEHFHYCNIGFGMLGHLIGHLDGKPWFQSVESRIMQPLGMTHSRAVINDRTRALRAKSYVPFFTDVTYVRNGRLAPAGDLVFEDGAGSVTSTPGDMAMYLRMLLNGGAYPGGRIVSAEGFRLFSTPYIKAPEFSETASYGYGIAVDVLDGHKILRHTGGMASFASSIHVDLEGGVAAFASINAMQGYRPIAVTQFAVQVMNAEAGHGKLPQPPELPSNAVKNAKEFAGTYATAGGKRVEVMVDGDRLVLHDGSAAIPLEHASGNMFLSTAPPWDDFPLMFSRKEEADKSGPMVELEYGPDWYTTEQYSGPRNHAEPAELQAFAGFYQSDSIWSGTTRIVLRKGKLWADGAVPLEPLGSALFRFGEEDYSPDTAQFLYMVDGKAQMMKLNGADFWRQSFG